MTKREKKCKVNARSISRKKYPKGSIETKMQYHKTAGRRLLTRGTNIQSSTKIGAGASTIRRKLPIGILHKRNHRSNEMMGFNPN